MRVFYDNEHPIKASMNFLQRTAQGLVKAIMPKTKTIKQRRRFSAPSILSSSVIKSSDMEAQIKFKRSKAYNSTQYRTHLLKTKLQNTAPVKSNFNVTGKKIISVGTSELSKLLSVRNEVETVDRFIEPGTKCDVLLLNSNIISQTSAASVKTYAISLGASMVITNLPLTLPAIGRYNELTVFATSNNYQHVHALQSEVFRSHTVISTDVRADLSNLWSKVVNFFTGSIMFPTLDEGLGSNLRRYKANNKISKCHAFSQGDILVSCDHAHKGRKYVLNGKIIGEVNRYESQDMVSSPAEIPRNFFAYASVGETVFVTDGRSNLEGRVISQCPPQFAFPGSPVPGWSGLPIQVHGNSQQIAGVYSAHKVNSTGHISMMANDYWTDIVRDTLLQHDSISVNVPCGTGKSSFLVQSLKPHFRSILVIEPRISLVDAVSMRLGNRWERCAEKDEFKAQNYLVITHGKFISTLLSDAHAFSKYELVILDESHDPSWLTRSCLHWMANTSTNLFRMAMTASPSNDLYTQLSLDQSLFDRTYVNHSAEITLDTVKKMCDERNDEKILVQFDTITNLRRYKAMLGNTRSFIEISRDTILSQGIDKLVTMVRSTDNVIVGATSVVAYGITLDVDTVIVPGDSIEPVVDFNGVNSMVKARISQNEFVQWAGRVGRTRPGTVIFRGPFTHAKVDNETALRLTAFKSVTNNDAHCEIRGVIFPRSQLVTALKLPLSFNIALSLCSESGSLLVPEGVSKPPFEGTFTLSRDPIEERDYKLKDGRTVVGLKYGLDHGIPDIYLDNTDLLKVKVNNVVTDDRFGSGRGISDSANRATLVKTSTAGWAIAAILLILLLAILRQTEHVYLTPIKEEKEQRYTELEGPVNRMGFQPALVITRLSETNEIAEEDLLVDLSGAFMPIPGFNDTYLKSMLNARTLEFTSVSNVLLSMVTVFIASLVVVKFPDMRTLWVNGSQTPSAVTRRKAGLVRDMFMRLLLVRTSEPTWGDIKEQTVEILTLIRERIRAFIKEQTPVVKEKASRALTASKKMVHDGLVQIADRIQPQTEVIISPDAVVSDVPAVGRVMEKVSDVKETPLGSIVKPDMELGSVVLVLIKAFTFFFNFSLAFLVDSFVMYLMKAYLAEHDLMNVHRKYVRSPHTVGQLVEQAVIKFGFVPPLIYIIVMASRLHFGVAIIISEVILKLRIGGRPLVNVASDWLSQVVKNLLKSYGFNLNHRISFANYVVVSMTMTALSWFPSTMSSPFRLANWVSFLVESGYSLILLMLFPARQFEYFQLKEVVSDIVAAMAEPARHVPNRRIVIPSRNVIPDSLSSLMNEIIARPRRGVAYIMLFPVWILLSESNPRGKTLRSVYEDTMSYFTGGPDVVVLPENTASCEAEDLQTHNIQSSLETTSAWSSFVLGFIVSVYAAFLLGLLSTMYFMFRAGDSVTVLVAGLSAAAEGLPGAVQALSETVAASSGNITTAVEALRVGITESALEVFNGACIVMVCLVLFFTVIWALSGASELVHTSSGTWVLWFSPIIGTVSTTLLQRYVGNLYGPAAGAIVDLLMYYIDVFLVAVLAPCAFIVCLISAMFGLLTPLWILWIIYAFWSYVLLRSLLLEVDLPELPITSYDAVQLKRITLDRVENSPLSGREIGKLCAVPTTLMLPANYVGKMAIVAEQQSRDPDFGGLMRLIHDGSRRFGSTQGHHIASIAAAEAESSLLAAHDDEKALANFQGSDAGVIIEEIDCTDELAMGEVRTVADEDATSVTTRADPGESLRVDPEEFLRQTRKPRRAARSRGDVIKKTSTMLWIVQVLETMPELILQANRVSIGILSLVNYYLFRKHASSPITSLSKSADMLSGCIAVLCWANSSILSKTVHRAEELAKWDTKATSRGQEWLNSRIALRYEDDIRLPKPASPVTDLNVMIVCCLNPLAVVVALLVNWLFDVNSLRLLMIITDGIMSTSTLGAFVWGNVLFACLLEDKKHVVETCCRGTLICSVLIHTSVGVYSARDPSRRLAVIETIPSLVNPLDVEFSSQSLSAFLELPVIMRSKTLPLPPGLINSRALLVASCRFFGFLRVFSQDKILCVGSGRGGMLQGLMGDVRNLRVDCVTLDEEGFLLDDDLQKLGLLDGHVISQFVQADAGFERSGYDTVMVDVATNPFTLSDFVPEFNSISNRQNIISSMSRSVRRLRYGGTLVMFVPGTSLDLLCHLSDTFSFLFEEVDVVQDPVVRGTCYYAIACRRLRHLGEITMSLALNNIIVTEKSGHHLELALSTIRREEDTAREGELRSHVSLTHILGPYILKLRDLVDVDKLEMPSFHVDEDFSHLSREYQTSAMRHCLPLIPLKVQASVDSDHKAYNCLFSSLRPPVPDREHQSTLAFPVVSAMLAASVLPTSVSFDVPSQCNDAMLFGLKRRYDFAAPEGTITGFRRTIDFMSGFLIKKAVDYNFLPVTWDELNLEANRKSTVGYMSKAASKRCGQLLDNERSLLDDLMTRLKADPLDANHVFHASPKVEKKEMKDAFPMVPRLFMYKSGEVRLCEMAMFKRLNDFMGKSKQFPFSASGDIFDRSARLADISKRFRHPRYIAIESSKWDGHKSASWSLVAREIFADVIEAGHHEAFQSRYCREVALNDALGYVWMASGHFIEFLRGNQKSGLWDTSINNKLVNTMIVIELVSRALRIPPEYVMNRVDLLVEGDDGIIVCEVEDAEAIMAMRNAVYHEAGFPQTGDPRVVSNICETMFCSHGVGFTIPHSIPVPVRPADEILGRLMLSLSSGPLTWTWENASRSLSSTISAAAMFWFLPEIRNLLSVVKHLSPPDVHIRAAHPSERWKVMNLLGGIDIQTFDLSRFVKDRFGVEDVSMVDLCEADRDVIGINKFRALATLQPWKVVLPRYVNPAMFHEASVEFYIGDGALSDRVKTRIAYAEKVSRDAVLSFRNKSIARRLLQSGVDMSFLRLEIGGLKERIRKCRARVLDLSADDLSHSDSGVLSGLKSVKDWHHAGAKMSRVCIHSGSSTSTLLLRTSSSVLDVFIALFVLWLAVRVLSLIVATAHRVVSQTATSVRGGRAVHRGEYIVNNSGPVLMSMKELTRWAPPRMAESSFSPDETFLMAASFTVPRKDHFLDTPKAIVNDWECLFKYERRFAVVSLSDQGAKAAIVYNPSYRNDWSQCGILDGIVAAMRSFHAQQANTASVRKWRNRIKHPSQWTCNGSMVSVHSFKGHSSYGQIERPMASLLNRLRGEGTFIMRIADTPVLTLDGYPSNQYLYGRRNTKARKRTVTGSAVVGESSAKWSRDMARPYAHRAANTVGPTTDWLRKLNVLFFRGGVTGPGFKRDSNVRIKLVEDLNKVISPLSDGMRIDVKFSRQHTRPRVMNQEAGMYHARDDIMGDFVPMVEQTKFRYLLVMEGNEAPDRVLSSMATGSLVILVRYTHILSRESWFSSVLFNRVHYVEVEADVNSVLAACSPVNIDSNVKIAIDGMVHARRLLTDKNQLSFMRNVLWQSKLFGSMNVNAGQKVYIVKTTRKKTLFEPSLIAASNIAVLSNNSSSGTRESFICLLKVDRTKTASQLKNEFMEKPIPVERDMRAIIEKVFERDIKEDHRGILKTFFKTNPDWYKTLIEYIKPDITVGKFALSDDPLTYAVMRWSRDEVFPSYIARMVYIVGTSQVLREVSFENMIWAEGATPISRVDQKVLGDLGVNHHSYSRDYCIAYKSHPVTGVFILNYAYVVVVSDPVPGLLINTGQPIDKLKSNLVPSQVFLMDLSSA
ncbi:hypothetical polyprotein [Diatom colony associated ssRNA virus 1]|uniref:hypothetical polyprotein n=1 Tax=Diatom colony associated ssRNA virus 1 TaxID=1678179 RepID=UPI0007A650C8|nr:hypothetical polyprotein [Diatom colony associated ssRNA virus 1]BAU79520.1 hypothetical polyprotein [Diatom colony associated ssRNA virus 1]